MGGNGERRPRGGGFSPWRSRIDSRPYYQHSAIIRVRPPRRRAYSLSQEPTLDCKVEPRNPPILSAYRERLSRTQRRIDNALPTVHSVENATMNQINCGEFAMRRIRRPKVIAASPMRVNRTARVPRT